MLQVQELSAIAPDGQVILTIGAFDGVHLGHQHLITRVVRRAAELACASGVITFHPHPLAVLRPGLALPMLTTPAERLPLLTRLGVDIIATLPFTAELSRLSAQAFVDLIRRHLRLRELWVGPDFCLGRDREGDIARLTQIGQQAGFSVHVVPPLVVEGAVVSSTRIRALLAEGDVSQAAELLGHCFAFGGTVLHGEGRGHHLGFPTANLAAEQGHALPANGTYAAHVFLPEEGGGPGRLLPAVVNVGIRPTFDGAARWVEAYILDFHQTIYGETLVVHFVQRLRGELRFAGAPELSAQLAKDVALARTILAAATACALS